jgi:hypothetical protein
MVSLWFSYRYELSLQSLLAALGSIQFVSNIAFAYVVLNKMVTVKYANYLAAIFNMHYRFTKSLLF